MAREVLRVVITLTEMDRAERQLHDPENGLRFSTFASRSSEAVRRRRDLRRHFGVSGPARRLSRPSASGTTALGDRKLKT